VEGDTSNFVIGAILSQKKKKKKKKKDDEGRQNFIRLHIIPETLK